MLTKCSCGFNYLGKSCPKCRGFNPPFIKKEEEEIEVYYLEVPKALIETCSVKNRRCEECNIENCFSSKRGRVYKKMINLGIQKGYFRKNKEGKLEFIQGN